jgi:hypothetical protein
MRIPISVIAVALFVACQGDRQTLFGVRGEPQKGMRRRDVDAVIQRHATPSLHQKSWAEGATEWLRITSNDSCILTIGFEEGKLTLAELRDEDMATAPCGGAPADLR